MSNKLQDTVTALYVAGMFSQHVPTMDTLFTLRTVMSESHRKTLKRQVRRLLVINQRFNNPWLDRALGVLLTELDAFTVGEAAVSLHDFFVVAWTVHKEKTGNASRIPRFRC